MALFAPLVTAFLSASLSALFPLALGLCPSWARHPLALGLVLLGLLLLGHHEFHELGLLEGFRQLLDHGRVIEPEGSQNSFDEHGHPHGDGTQDLDELDELGSFRIQIMGFHIDDFYPRLEISEDIDS